MNIPTLEVGKRQPIYYRFDMRPLPKERARAFKQRGRMRTFTPQRTKEYELLIEQATSLQHPFEQPLEGDLIANVNFYFENRIHGDLDNCLKAILDGMQGVAFKNDKQIRGFNVHAFYFDELDEDERRERTEVIITHRKKPNERP